MDVSEVLTDRKVNIKSNCLLSYTAAKAKALCNGDVRLFVCAFVRLSRAGLLVLSLVTGVPYVSSTVKTHPPREFFCQRRGLTCGVHKRATLVHHSLSVAAHHNSAGTYGLAIKNITRFWLLSGSSYITDFLATFLSNAKRLRCDALRCVAESLRNNGNDA